MAGASGREIPQPPTSQASYQPGLAQSQGQQQVGQSNALAAQLAPEDAGKITSHPGIVSLQATRKSGEMQVDFLASNNGAADQLGFTQSFKQFIPAEAQSTQPRNNTELELEEVQDRRTGNGQDRFKLTAQNLDSHEQQLLQQKASGVRLVAASNVQVSNIPPQKAAQITIPIEGHPGSGGGQQPAITIPASNPGPGRPVGSNNAARQKKAQQQAAQAATQQNPVQNVQASQVQAVTSQQPIIPVEAQQAQQAAVLSQSQQQQQIILQQQIKAQQQQQQRPQMNNEQYLAYQQQQRQLQHQNNQNSISGVHSAQQVEIIRQQQAQVQAFAAQQASQSGHPQAAPAYQGLTAADSQTHGKVIANTVRTRVSQNFQDKMTFLISADKQHADSLAKQIKKEEFQFFLKNDDTRYYKKDLLEQKNQRMDEYISYCAENGGRVIPKQPEPIAPPHETPVIIEMRYMHMDLVEEAYWKRHMACLLARQCKQVAIRKAHEKTRRQKEEQSRLNEQQKREEYLRREEQANPAIQYMVVDQIGSNVQRSHIIDTSMGTRIHPNSGVGREQDLLPRANLFGDDLLEHNVSFEDNIGEVDAYGNDIDILSMGGGMGIGLDEDMGLELIDPVRETIDHANQGNGFPVDEADNYDEPFDPEQELRRQEEILEQQRIEESNKQELEKLKKIEEIEKMSSKSDESCRSSQRRVVRNLAEDSEIDSDKEDQLAALENEILLLDLAYLKPDTDKRERNLKQATEEEKSANQHNQDIETANQTNQSKKIFKTAKSAIKQKFDRLGQMLLENKGSCASEMIQSEQFQQIVANMVEEGEKKELAHDSLFDKVTTLLSSDQEIGIYVMPGIDAFEFDSDQDAIEERNSQYDINSADSDMDIDGFFNEINSYEKTAQNDKKVKKLRPPSIIGDEQQKLYEELKEINQLAPERNDLGHMQHLCRFWTEQQQEEIQEKKFIKEYLEKNLRLDDQGTRGDQQMDRKQRLALQQNIETQRQNIEAYIRNLEKYQRPDYQPKELHRERFLLSGQEMPQQQHQQLAPQEFSFIKWYYALFPDQWRLIADIINYHPLTRGPLHCKEFMAREYFSRLDSNHRELLLGRQKIQMQPWRETKLPWLINGREGCLMNSMTYVNKSHLQSIHRVSRLTRKQRKIKTIYNFVVDSQGCLGLQFVQGYKPAPILKPKPENEFSQPEELKPEHAGIKRIRAEIETDEGSACDVDMEDSRAYSDSEVQDRLLSQMLARRRKDEAEETAAAERGILIKEDIYRDRPYLKEMMVNIAQKRRKLDSNTSQLVPLHTAFSYDPVRVQKDELDTNTPMWYALQNQKSCQMTIRVQHSTMFWLGYFIRRLMHEENLEKLKFINSDKLNIWEAENEIKNFFINQSKKIRLDDILFSSNQKEHQVALVKAQEKEEQDLQKEIQHFLRAQVANLNRVEIHQVSDLWDGKSPYYYDREQKAEYMKQEKDYVERISNVMYQKSKHLWEELQFYWFQVNKNLNPRYRKIDQIQGLVVQDQSPQYANSQQAQLRQQVGGYEVAKQGASLLAQPISQAAQIASLTPNNNLVLTQRQIQGVGQIGASSSQTMIQPSGNLPQSQYQMQNIQATTLSQAQIGQMSSAGVNPQYQATVQNRGQPLTPQSAQRRQQYPPGQFQQYGSNGADVQMQGQQVRAPMAPQNSGGTPSSVQTALPTSSNQPSNGNSNPQ